MKLFRWSKELETGIRAIDAQHRELVRRVNAFLTECQESGGTRENMLRTFNFLRPYAIGHFDTEFGLMQEYDYPQLGPHQRAHERVREWVESTAEKLQTADIDTNFTLEVNYHLVDWLENHFRTMDRRLTDYLRELAQSRQNKKLSDLIKGVLPGQDKK